MPIKSKDPAAYIAELAKRGIIVEEVGARAAIPLCAKTIGWEFSSDVPKQAKTPKYRNKKTANGFASKKEEKRWGELLLLEMRGSIRDLEKQVTFRLEVNGQLICKYIADFVFVENGVRVVEDVKSPITRKNPTYRIKNKMMKAIHNITIRET